jgi:hypothetical protein
VRSGGRVRLDQGQPRLPLPIRCHRRQAAHAAWSGRCHDGGLSMGDQSARDRSPDRRSGVTSVPTLGGAARSPGRSRPARA